MTKHEIMDFSYRGALLDELVIFAAQLEVIVEGFGNIGIEMPEWLARRTEEVKTELADRIEKRKSAA